MKKIFTLSIISVLALIKSMNAQQPCIASFLPSQQPNYAFAFFDASIVFQYDSVVSHYWDFGDPNSINDTSTLANPLYIYPASGIYTVCLIILTDSGCTDTFCLDVIPCQIDISFVADTTQNGILANASGGVPPYFYLWSNADTKTSITNIAPGVYTVTVTDAGSCSSSQSITFPFVSCLANFTHVSVANSNDVVFKLYTSADSIYWDMGDGTFYSDSSILTHTYASSGNYTVCISTFDNGAPCDTVCNTINFIRNSSVVCGYIFIDTNGNGIIDNNEQGLSNQYITYTGNNSQGYLYTDANGYYSILANAGTIHFSTLINSIYTVTFPPGPNLVTNTILLNINDTLCGFNIALMLNSVHITGTVYDDVNADGVFNNGDWPIPYNPVTIGTITYYTNTNGIFDAFVPIGNYTVTYVSLPILSAYPLTTSAAYIVNAPTPGTYGGNNFGLDLPISIIDLKVDLSTAVLPRPGQYYVAYVFVTNANFTPVNFDLTFNYDSNIVFISAMPAQSSLNAANKEIIWNAGIIYQTQTKLFTTTFYVPTNVDTGTWITNSVNVVPGSGNDIDLTNNDDTLKQRVVNSCDPNNKLVISTNFIDPAFQVVSSQNADQQIKYCINFQNTGSAEAINIIVIDTLDSDLDANTYEFISSSHTCIVTRNGQEVIYKFPNIWLPDSNTNESLSHGNILFKMKAKPNLIAGTLLEDNADIYFDFNAAVVTNNTNILLATTLGHNQVTQTLDVISVAPNPTDGIAQMQFTHNITEVATLNVYNAVGKLIHTSAVQIFTGVNKFSLPSIVESGMFCIQVINNNNLWNGRLIVK